MLGFPPATRLRFHLTGDGGKLLYGVCDPCRSTPCQQQEGASRAGKVLGQGRCHQGCRAQL